MDVVVDLIARQDPFGKRGWERALGSQANAAVDGHPAHQARVEKLLAAPAHFPNSFIRGSPILCHPIDEWDQIMPKPVTDRLTPFIVEIDRIHQLTVNVQLELVV